MEFQLPRFGLGTNRFGTRVDVALAREILAAAFDEGVTLIDTAESYGEGTSESVIGEALAGRRGEFVIATKVSPKNDPRTACEASLRRLRTDYIDLYQFHFPNPDIPIERTLESLAALVDEGKVRAIGNSNFAGWQIADADWTSRTKGFPRFVAAENLYSLLERAVEREVLPACRRFGQGFLPFLPLASGLLTGKYRRGEPAPEGTRLSSPRGAQALSDRNFDVVEPLEAFAAQRGVSMAAVALGWLAAQPQVTSVIAGATSPEQVAANVEATAWEPTEDDLAELDRITAARR